MDFLDQPKEIDRATLWGACGAFGLVLLAILLGGGLGSFIDLRSLLIVLGGTCGATLITFPLDDFQRTFEIIRPALFPNTSSIHYRIDRLIELAQQSRKEGDLSLESYASRESDPFLRHGIELLADGVAAEDIRRTLELDLAYLSDRHRRGAHLLQTMGTIAPAMGLIGTLIGLVRMLENLDNPAALGPAMATALLTTFYGAMLAYILFIPLAGKLRARSEEERLLKELTIEGILCIKTDTNPRIIEQRLHSFIPHEQRYSRYE